MRPRSAAEDAVLREGLDPRAHPGQAQPQRGVQAVIEAGHAVGEVDAGPHDPLRGRRRRGGAVVGHEVRDRVVGLVPDGGHHGSARGGDRPRDALLVEGLEILEAAAATGDHQHVEAEPVEGLDAVGHLGRRSLALNPSGIDLDVEAREATAQHVQEVPQRRSAGRRDDADPARQGRQRPLPLRREQPLAGQPLLELLEGLLERAHAEGLHHLHRDLVLAARRVEAEPSRTRTRAPSRGRWRMRRAAVRHTTAWICARASFREKYQWPESATRRFETSPSTQTSNSSVSSRPWIRSVRPETLSTRRGAGARTGPRSAPKSRRLWLIRAL